MARSPSASRMSLYKSKEAMDTLTLACLGHGHILGLRGGQHQLAHRMQKRKPH
jgi:hypothetical protein